MSNKVKPCGCRCQESNQHKSFGDRTTIHGLPDIVTAESKQSMYLWTAVFIGCLAAFSAQAAYLTINFRSEPIASYVQAEYPTQFPPMIVCPDNYQFSLAKLAERDTFQLSAERHTQFAQKYYGGDEAAVQAKINRSVEQYGLETGNILSVWFLKSLQYYGFITAMEETVKLYWFKMEQNPTEGLVDLYFLSLLMDMTKDDVQQHFWNTFLRSNESVAEITLDLTLDFLDVITSYEFLGLGFEYRYNMMTVHGACYGFRFKQVAIMEFITYDNDAWYDIPDVYSVGGTSRGILVYFSELSFLPSNPFVILDYHQHHNVEISMTRVKRENLRRRPCRNWSQHHYATCVSDCYNRRYCNNEEKRLINGSRACTLWHPDITREEEHGRLCNWWDGEGSLAMENKNDEQFHCLAESTIRTDRSLSDECTIDCPIVCADTMYYPTIVRSNAGDNELLTYTKTFVIVKFHKPNSEFLIEERREFTSVSFVSNLGGTLSLWIGASFLSLIQMGCYFASRTAQRFRADRM